MPLALDLLTCKGAREEENETSVRFSRSDTSRQSLISIAGRLEEGYLTELEALCADARATLVFDLSELKGADDAAIRWLVDQVNRGNRMTGASPYIGYRLERESAGHDRQPEEEPK